MFAMGLQCIAPYIFAYYMLGHMVKLKEFSEETARFKQVYRSENGMATLYERVDKRNQFCAIGPETATPAGNWPPALITTWSFST